MPLRSLIALGWTLLILALCSIPGQDLPDLNVWSMDKVGHFGVFAIYGWLWLAAWTPRRSNAVAWVLVTGVAYAVFTELYQGWLPWDRTPDPYDVLADVAGLVAGVAAWVGWQKKRRPVSNSA